MIRLALAAGMVVWVGATLILWGSSRLSRPSLADRLRPFSPGSAAPGRRTSTWSVHSVRDVLMPLARDLGDVASRLFGVAESCETRLRRIHSDRSAAAFRGRQMAWAAVALITGAAAGAAMRPPIPAAVLLVVGAPVLAFLVEEQTLARASERWQQATEAELPVVAEQLAMLLNAGFSLGSALSRLASRGQGCVSLDLQQVVNRMQQGLSEGEALEEWALRSGSPAVGRLVSVLRLHSAGADLGRLVTAEARQTRRELHRRTVETLERRSQQVWVPVTVATLVPGAILLAVPFLAALRLFANA